MKRQALELVRRIFNNLKFEITKGADLEELINASIVQANFICSVLMEENPDQKDKYEMLQEEIGKIDRNKIYQ